MWLILCHPADAAAHWAAQGLLARGLAPVRVVHPEELAQWSRWEHRIGAGGVSTRLVLADGCAVDESNLRGVLNRLGSLPPGPLAGADDYDYVAQELRALFWSWLAGLGVPVVDPPGPHGFAGPGHLSEWLPLAARAGLPVPVYRQGSDDGTPPAAWGELAPPARTVLVVGAEVFGAPPSGNGDGATAAACVRLAAAAGASLLGVDLAAADGASHFASANPVPDLRLGGEPLLDALARRLRPEVAA